MDCKILAWTCVILGEFTPRIKKGGDTYDNKVLKEGVLLSLRVFYGTLSSYNFLIRGIKSYPICHCNHKGEVIFGMLIYL